LFRSSVFRSNGSCGEIQGASTAPRIITAATSAAPIATGLLRKLWKTSPSRKRARAEVLMETDQSTVA
jgi:hypothetical protein